MRLLLTVILLLSLTACVTVQTPPPAKTVIHDQAEAELLLGKHLFTEGSVTDGRYKYFGDVTVTNDNGVYRIKGEHERYWPAYRAEHLDSGGYIRIDGVIVEINSLSFVFEGKIEYYFDTTIRNGDHNCRALGRFTFSRQRHLKYWRLAERKDLCDSDNRMRAHNVDIFTASRQDEPPRGRTTRRPDPDKGYL